jgi:hypothetical protein
MTGQPTAMVASRPATAQHQANQLQMSGTGNASFFQMW